MHRSARGPALALLLVVLAACAQTDPPTPSSVPPGDGSPEPGAASPSAPPGSAAELAWTELAPAPLARLEMATAAHDGRIWMAGGLSPLGEAVSEVEIYDPATGEWSSGPTLPTGIHHSTLVSDGDRLLLIGGYLGVSFNQPTEIVLTLADGAASWEPGPSLPEGRGAGAGAWDGARVIYAGGVGPGGVSGDVLALEGETWTRIGSMPRAREHIAATSDGEGRTWILGGRVGSLESNLADVDLVEGDSVTALDPLPTPRGGVGAFFLPELGACLTGGEAVTGAYTVVECVDLDGNVSTAAEMLVPRHGHGAAVVDGTAYVLLGGPTPGLSAHSSVESLVPAE